MISFIITLFTLLGMSDILSNPLVKPSGLPYGVPNFPEIKVEHFRPAIVYGIEQHQKEIDALLAKSAAETPSFVNTLLPFEASGDILSFASQCFSNLCGSDSNDEMRALEDELIPLFAQHHDAIYFNPTLFQRIRDIYQRYFDENENIRNGIIPAETSILQLIRSDQKDAAAINDAGLEPLSMEDLQLIKHYYRTFTKSGATLPQESQKLLSQYTEHLSSLENKFNQNLVHIDETEGVTVDSLDQLEGLEEDEIAAAQERAEKDGLPAGSYVLGLVNTSRNPLLVRLKNRQVREKLWKCSTQRGLSGQFQQSTIVRDIILTRAKIAKLMQFPNYAEKELLQEMAKTPENALKMLSEMLPGVVASLQRDKEQIIDVMRQDGIFAADLPTESCVVEPWDWEFYQEKVRANKFNFDSSVARHYFVHEDIIEHGVFYTMNKLFGITFQRRDDIPVYHPDVIAYELHDADGSPIGIFWADYFKRSGKAGGAWMTNFVPPNRQRGQYACVANVMNVIKSTDASKPTFLSLDEAATCFHELGHGLHSFFGFNVNYSTLSGTEGVSTDFVEFPSTFQEDWAHYPEIISNYARHYETKELIPQDLIKKVIAANQFGQAYDTYEYLAAAIIDLAWHQLSLEQAEALLTTPGAETDPTALAEVFSNFERDVMAKYNAHVPYVAPRYKTQYFCHSMTSYCSKYYAYLWSEVLAADAWRYMTREMKPQTGPTRANGDKFRFEVLAQGNIRDTMESYKQFRGQAPTTEALLIRRGLLPDQ